MSPDINIDELIKVIISAGRRVLEIYEDNDIDVEYKRDNTPLTLADKLSQDTILAGLTSLYPDIPCISEETTRAAFSVRKNWDYFWLIDPLDGTKEFIKKNGEFTINVALIKKEYPVLGFIYLPAKKLLYFSQKGTGAFKQVTGAKAEPISVNKQIGEKVIVTKSRSHSSRLDEKIISSLGGVRAIDAGSSLKFCYVAEGKADVYLRGGRTMEWDTAAGQCIAESAGARIIDFSGKRLAYNKKSLLNPKFICFPDSKPLEKKILSCL